MWISTGFPIQATVCCARAVCILWRWNWIPWISLLNVLLTNRTLPCHFISCDPQFLSSPCKAPCVFFLWCLSYALYCFTWLSSPAQPNCYHQYNPIVIAISTRLSSPLQPDCYRYENQIVIAIKPDSHRQHNPIVIASITLLSLLSQPDFHRHATRLSSPVQPYCHRYENQIVIARKPDWYCYQNTMSSPIQPDCYRYENQIVIVIKPGCHRQHSPVVIASTSVITNTVYAAPTQA